MNNEFVDKEIKCKDCKDVFTFTAGEAEFFHERQFQEPKRCQRCRKLKTQQHQQAN